MIFFCRDHKKSVKADIDCAESEKECQVRVLIILISSLVFLTAVHSLETSVMQI